jgi:hypothetical protein
MLKQHQGCLSQGNLPIRADVNSALDKESVNRAHHDLIDVLF